MSEQAAQEAIAGPPEEDSAGEETEETVEETSNEDVEDEEGMVEEAIEEGQYEEELDEELQPVAAVVKPLWTYDPCPPDCEFCKYFPAPPKEPEDPENELTEEELMFADALLTVKHREALIHVVPSDEEEEVETE